jgi:ABC-type branched-subunit amino acid transport system ATPase component
LQPSVAVRLGKVLAATRREQQTAMLVVEQHIRFALANRFAVFTRGEVVDSGVADVTSAERIDEHMRTGLGKAPWRKS